jgi:hypothetical protein
MNRIRFLMLSIILLALFCSSHNTPAAQPGVETAEEEISCEFELDGRDPVIPLLSGPTEQTSIVHIVDQPDSPIEITAIDLSQSLLALYEGGYPNSVDYKWEESCRLKIRNRSDREIKDASIQVSLRHKHGGVGGGGVLRRKDVSGLAAGQETPYLEFCGGHASGTRVREGLRLVFVTRYVDFENCRYFPSMRLPRSGPVMLRR